MEVRGPPPPRPPPPYTHSQSPYPLFDSQLMPQGLNCIGQDQPSEQNIGFLPTEAQNGYQAAQEVHLYPEANSNLMPQCPCPNGQAPPYEENCPYPDEPTVPAFQELHTQPYLSGPAPAYPVPDCPFPQEPAPTYQEPIPPPLSQDFSIEPQVQHYQQQASDQMIYLPTEAPPQPAAHTQPQSGQDQTEPSKGLFTTVKQGAVKAKNFLQKQSQNGNLGNAMQAVRIAISLAKMAQGRGNPNQFGRNYPSFGGGNGRSFSSQTFAGGHSHNDLLAQQMQGQPSGCGQEQFLNFGQAGTCDNLQYEQLMNQMQSGVDSGVFDPQFLSYLQGSSTADLEQLMSQMPQSGGDCQFMNFAQSDVGCNGGMGDFSQMMGTDMGSFSQFSGADFGSSFGGMDFGGMDFGGFF